MILVNTQHIEGSGDPGGNRTRDNLIKSHNLFSCLQTLIGHNYVKLSIIAQWVMRYLSNYDRGNMELQKLCKTCDKLKTITEFYKTNSPCKACVKAQKIREYHSDLETSRLSNKVRYNSPKAVLHRIKNFMKQYEE